MLHVDKKQVPFFKEYFDNKTDDEHSSYTSVSGTEAENADEMENGQNNADEQVKNTAMITSCVDSGITGTVGLCSFYHL